jgi:hypothetical protein
LSLRIFITRAIYSVWKPTLIFLLVLLQVACAGTARGIKSSVYQSDEPESEVATASEHGEAMVIIRYPVLVDPDAEESYYRSFAANNIGGEVSITHQHRKDSRHIARSIIAKSNYYAMSLYAELSALLPEHSVLLSPHMLIDDGAGVLSSVPMLASEEIPSILTIDFSVYSFPDAARIMDAPPLTLGDVVTPLFVIQGDRWLSPSTNGVLLSSEPLLGSAWVQSEVDVKRHFSQLLEPWNPPQVTARPLAYVSFLANGAPDELDLPLKSVAESRREVTAVGVYPLEKIHMDGDLVDALDADSDDRADLQEDLADPFAEEFIRGAANRIVADLAEIDLSRASFFPVYRALSEFDPELARNYLAGSNLESVQARLSLGEAVIEAKKKFLSAQSRRIYNGTYQGAYGKNMRRLIAGEYRFLEKKRHLARVQNVATAISVVTLAGSIFAASGAASGAAAAVPLTGATLALGFSSVFVLNRAFDARNRSALYGESFLARIAPDLKQQVSVNTEIQRSEQEITAQSYLDFRQQIQAMYHAEVRSIPSTGTQDCTFSYPGIDQPGLWYGDCNHGLAVGQGFGIALGSTGVAIEYVGMAGSGMAQGRGVMLEHNMHGIGALLYDGTFVAGLPEGNVRVEQPGRKPRFRTYQRGMDTGRGKADLWQAWKFP